MPPITLNDTLALHAVGSVVPNTSARVRETTSTLRTELFSSTEVIRELTTELKLLRVSLSKIVISTQLLVTLLSLKIGFGVNKYLISSLPS